jgi:hypothetical protein
LQDDRGISEPAMSAIFRILDVAVVALIFTALT